MTSQQEWFEQLRREGALEKLADELAQGLGPVDLSGRTIAVASLSSDGDISTLTVAFTDGSLLVVHGLDLEFEFSQESSS